MKKVDYFKLIGVDAVAMFLLFWLTLASYRIEIIDTGWRNNVEHMGDWFSGLFIEQTFLKGAPLLLIPIFALLFLWVIHLCINRSNKSFLIAIFNAVVFCVVGLLAYYLYLFFIEIHEIYILELFTFPRNILSSTIIHILVAVFFLRPRLLARSTKTIFEPERGESNDQSIPHNP